MKVCIIGAGAVASVLSHFLARDDAVIEILICTRDLPRAKEFVDASHPKIRFTELDASNVSHITKSASGADLLINASLPRFNTAVMTAALNINAHYQDLASELKDYIHPEQLNFHAQFQKAERIALINTGVSPGVTNVLAAETADILDPLESLKFRLVEDQETNEPMFAWSPEVAIDELTSPPLIFREGAVAFTRPFADDENFTFPHPFGKRRVFSIYGDEVATIPRYLDVQHVDYKSGGSDIEFGKALFRLGMFRKEPVSVKGQRIIPLDLFSYIAPKVPTPKEMRQAIQSGAMANAQLCVAVEAEGKQYGKRRRIRAAAAFPDLRAITKVLPGATYISYPTGLAAYLFAKILPFLHMPGVYPPEALPEELRTRMLSELEGHGIIITKRYSAAA